MILQVGTLVSYILKDSYIILWNKNDNTRETHIDHNRAIWFMTNTENLKYFLNFHMHTKSKHSFASQKLAQRLHSDPANIKRNKHVMNTSKRCFDVTIACLLRSVFVGEISLWYGHFSPKYIQYRFYLICALNKRFNKPSWGWKFETPSCSLWRQCSAVLVFMYPIKLFKGFCFDHTYFKSNMKYIRHILIDQNQT